MMVSSSSGESVNLPSWSAVGGSESSDSVSVSAAELAMLAEGSGHMGVDGGYIGVIGTFASKGSTKAFQGPWKLFPSM